MNCPTCKNPIPENSISCDWCGASIAISNDVIKENIILLDKPQPRKGKQVGLYLLPGVIVFLIWVIGNLLSERNKQAIFSMDDLSPILFLAIGLLIVGFVLNLIINKKNELSKL